MADENDADRNLCGLEFPDVDYVCKEMIKDIKGTDYFDYHRIREELRKRKG